MGIAVAIGGGLGYWLDRTFHTKPWLMLVFLLFGVAAGFKGVIDAAKKASRDVSSSNPRQEEKPNDDGR